MKKILLSFLISICLFSLTYAADFGGIGGRPAHPDGLHPNNKEWFIYELNLGETKQDEIQVQNNDDKENTIVLYPADSVPSTDGGFALKQQVESRDFVGKWIQLSQTEVKLGPHEAANIPFTITIPNDPKLDVGEHTGAILMQKLTPEANENAGGMQLLTRVGVRVYVTIPGEVIKKLEIAKFDVEPNPLKEIYTASLTIKNTGNVSQALVIKMKVTNLYPWLNDIPWIKDFFKDYPLENERNLQVLRDDSLISNFEFKKPLFGKLKIEALVTYDDGQTLVAEPIELNVGLDTNIIILLVLVAAFLVSLIAFLVLRKKSKKQKNDRKLSKNVNVKSSSSTRKKQIKNRKQGSVGKNNKTSSVKRKNK